jgi:uncharacterized repeat protein (TIGR01451 family)
LNAKRMQGRGRSALRAVVVLVFMAPIVGVMMPARAGGSTYQTGDVFVSVDNGLVQWRQPDGTLIQTLDNQRGGFTTGMAFDSSGNLYVTDVSGTDSTFPPVDAEGLPQSAQDIGSVTKFDTQGNLIGPFGSGYNAPESILFDKAGNAYVSNVGGNTFKFDADGNLVQTFATGRTDWIELAADQCTLFYTDESGSIHRYDVCNDVPLSDFGSGGLYALRILPAGGLVAADAGVVNRFDDAGNVIQSYDAPGEDSWFALNLDPDGTSLWSADFTTADVVKFDIATGDVLESFNTGTGTFTVFGLSVFGEIVVGGGGSADLSLVKEDSSSTIVVGDPLTYTIDVSNAGPDEAPNVVVTDPIPSELTFESATATQGSCSESGGTVTCALGTLAVDSSATITINTTANAEGTITNTASVSSSASDPDPSNNSDPATTTIAPSGGVQTGAGGTAPRPSSPLWFFVVLVGLVVGARLAVRRTQKT